MKIAVVYNRESRKVINLFGQPNKEKIGLKTIKRVTDALKAGGHQVISLEGDKDLVDRLEEFMPRVLKHERPGMVFNVSYGIQGQARYTHVPSILEMVGIPYVASGPLAHSLALDKVVTKMILRQHGLPTPDFAVLDAPDATVPELKYPLIVKPKNEAVSFGLKVVDNEQELRDAAGVIFNEYSQPVLVEQFISGREINVGLLGNNPPETLPPVELLFGEDGPAIYTYEDKTGRSGRTISHACPAPIGEELLEKAQDIARRAFTALGCYDCARVDMRLDEGGNLYILEINSLPSLGEHGSYTIGAEHVGLDFPKLVNRLVEVASARYFGTPEPPRFDSREPESQVFSYITQRRDQQEKRLREWTALSSRTMDPVGLSEAFKRLDEMLTELGLRKVDAFSKMHTVSTWQTRKGFEGGMLFVGHVDTPVEMEFPSQSFRRDPEWLYGEGIGASRAPMVMLEYALRALRNLRQLRRLPLGVLYYADEGRDARYSAETIREACAHAGRVFVLRPANLTDTLITQRRGLRRYRLRVSGEAVRLGRSSKKPTALGWTLKKLELITELSSSQRRVSVTTVELNTESLPMRVPHRVNANVVLTYPKTAVADELEEQIRVVLGKGGPPWQLNLIAERPPMAERRDNGKLYAQLADIAAQWEMELRSESSTWPSAAGLVPRSAGCICGLGPVAREVGTPDEAVQRISLVQRTLLLAEFLAHQYKSVNTDGTTASAQG